MATGRAGIAHELGAWQGTFHGYATPNDERLYYHVDLTGEGAYEGLSAILFVLDNGTGFDVEGIDLPRRAAAVPGGARRRVDPIPTSHSRTRPAHPR